MARTVTRMGIPSRVQTNANAVQSQEFIPGPTIPSAALSSPNATQQTGVPQSNLINNNQTEVKNVTTPEGQIQVKYSIIQGSGQPIVKPVSIVKNITFNVPYTSSSNGFTNSGTTTYDYALNQNSIVQQVVSQKGSVVYDGVDVANINNGTIIPTTNKISQSINSNNQYLGTITYVPTVSNNILSLSYSSFTGTTVQKTVPVYYTDPFSGMEFKVGYTYSSNPTTYNPQTNQVNLTFPNINQVFGMTPLYLNSQSTTVTLNGTPTKVFYNINTGPSGGSTYFTGFNVGGNSQQKLYITSGGSTSEFNINQGSIVNSQNYSPISLSGVKTGAVLTYNNGQYSIQNTQATEYLGGGIDVIGNLGLTTTPPSGQTLTPNSAQLYYSFTPTQYILEGSKTLSTNTPNQIGLVENLLTSQGFTTAQIQSIFSQQPTSITESINSKTGVLSIGYTPYATQKSFFIDSNYITSGYLTYNSQGQVIGGANFVNPKSFQLTSSQSYTDSNGNIFLNLGSLPKGYLTTQYTTQLSNLTNNYFNSISPNSALTNSNSKALIQVQNDNTGAEVVNYFVNVGIQAYKEGYETGNNIVSVNQGFSSFIGTLAQGEAPVFVVAAPESALLGAILNIGTSEAVSYATTGSKLSSTGFFQAASLGAISGGVLGGLSSVVGAAGQSELSFVVGQTSKLVFFNSLIGAGINSIYGFIQPSAFLGSASNPSSTISAQSNPQPSILGLLKNQPNIPQTVNNTPSVSSSTFLSGYLNFVATGGLEGANFATSYGGEVSLGSLAISKAFTAIPGTLGSILQNPLVSKPVIAIGFGASSYGVGVALGEPQKEALISGILIGVSTLVTGGSESKSSNTLTPENTAAFFKVSATGNSIDIADTRTITPLDLLNNMGAQNTYYLNFGEGEVPEGVTSTPTYQVSFNNGKILYSVTPDVELTQEGLSGASYEIGSKLYGSDRAYFAATATDRIPVTDFISASESNVQLIAITNLDTSGLKGKVFGIDSKDIVNAKLISYGDIQAGTTDTQTQFGAGQGEQRLIFDVKNNFFQRLMGNPIKQIIVSDNFINTDQAIVTPGGNENFIGRLTTGTETESTGSFYGEKGSPDILSIKKVFGDFVGESDYTGKVLTQTPEGDTTQSLILYYETNNLADIASKVGFDAGTSPFEPTDISTSPLKPFPSQLVNLGETDSVTTPTTGGQSQVTSSIEQGIIKGAPPVSLQAITIPAESTVTDIATSPLFQLQPQKTASVTGLDPIIQAGQKMSTSVIPTLGITSSVSTRQGISNSEIQKSIFPSTTSNAFLSTSKYANASLFKTGLSTGQKTGQKNRQSNKQKPSTSSAQLNRGSFPITPIPNTKFDNNLNPFPFKLKNTKPQVKRRKIEKSIYFGYTPDLSHALLNIIGTKTNIGLSRPISKRSKK